MGEKSVGRNLVCRDTMDSPIKNSKARTQGRYPNMDRISSIPVALVIAQVSIECVCWSVMLYLNGLSLGQMFPVCP